jgi:hypothetical protein
MSYPLTVANNHPSQHILQSPQTLSIFNHLIISQFSSPHSGMQKKYFLLIDAKNTLPFFLDSTLHECSLSIEFAILDLGFTQMNSVFIVVGFRN